MNLLLSSWISRPPAFTRLPAKPPPCKSSSLAAFTTASTTCLVRSSFQTDNSIPGASLLLKTCWAEALFPATVGQLRAEIHPNLFWRTSHSWPSFLFKILKALCLTGICHLLCPAKGLLAGKGKEAKLESSEEQFLWRGHDSFPYYKIEFLASKERWPCTPSLQTAFHPHLKLGQGHLRVFNAKSPGKGSALSLEFS